MRHEYEYHYTICNMPDKVLFEKQSKALEKHIPGIKKAELLHDVDDSLYQSYYLNGKKIAVCNDEQIGALYVDSDIELTQFFKQSDKAEAV